MIRTGWVRIHVMTPNVGSLIEGHVMTVGPSGDWTITYMVDRVTPWRLDEASQLDTLISLINRYEHPEEVIVQSWWHAQDGTTLARLQHECYYTEQLLLSAKDCLAHKE